MASVCSADAPKNINVLNMKKELNQIIATAIKKQNNLSFKCFKKGCSEKAINSHSQSLSNTLRRISEDGHLIRFRPAHFMSGVRDFGLWFQKIGVKRASTFKGFCAKHDHKYFGAVDNIDPQDITKETLAKLAFRAFAYEERAKEKALFLLDYMVENAATLCDVSYMEGGAVGIRNHLKVTKPYYLKKFITMFESQDYARIYGTVFILNKMLPLSCSTVIDPTVIDSSSLTEWDLRKPLIQTFFALIPQPDSSLVIFAYFDRQKTILKKFISKYRSLENILFNHCEEMLMNPGFYDSLGSELKYKIINGLRGWAFWKRQNFPDLFNMKLESPIYI